MEFKKLEIEPEGNAIKRFFTSAHFKRSLLYILIGAIAGFGFFYLTEGKDMNHMAFSDILRSLAIGGFFGFFITNSPCARGRC